MTHCDANKDGRNTVRDAGSCGPGRRNQTAWQLICGFAYESPRKHRLPALQGCPASKHFNYSKQSAAGRRGHQGTDRDRAGEPGRGGWMEGKWGYRQVLCVLPSKQGDSSPSWGPIRCRTLWPDPRSGWAPKHFLQKGTLFCGHYGPGPVWVMASSSPPGDLFAAGPQGCRQLLAVTVPVGAQGR